MEKDEGQRVDLKGMSRQELAAFLGQLGAPPYRAIQIMHWLYQRRCDDFQAMTDLPLELRQILAQRAAVDFPPVLECQRSRRTGTVKLLVGLPDGEAVECVLLPYEYGWSICVSSQVGCPLGCSFCASGLGGWKRNLTTEELMGQVLAAARYLDGSGRGERIGHVVVMGMGEPLFNLESVLAFLQLAHDDEGLGIGYRHMTISTAGVVPGIYRLAAEGLPITLAVSLHAANDTLRSQLMPINRRFPLDQLLRACRFYIEKTGSRITFEYLLLHEVNDRPEDAEALAALVKGLKCHINLIPANPVPETGLQRSSPARVKRFQNILIGRGCSVTVRRQLGTEIDAACGQLRRRYLAGGGEEK